MPAGAAGGLVGGALSLFTLKLGGLAGAGATTRNALVGTAVLTVLGGAGAYLANEGVVRRAVGLALPVPALADRARLVHRHDDADLAAAGRSGGLSRLRRGALPP